MVITISSFSPSKLGYRFKAFGKDCSSRPVLTVFFILVFSYFVIQLIFQYLLKHLEKNYDLIIRLFNIIVHYMNELALRAL